MDRIPLDPFPSGWFAVAFSSDLARGEVRPVTAFGRELVAYRTASGRAYVREAWCPHLGAHLGHGGEVVGEEIRCPFHGFRFDADGRCVHNPYGRPPRRAHSPALPVREQEGALFAWHGDEDEQPFDLPTFDPEGWTPWRTHAWSDLPTHPQEITENVVDIGHFAAVHQYGATRPTAPLDVDGPVLRAAYAFRREGFLAGLAPAIEPRFRVAVHGLGYSLVEVDVPDYGLASRQLVAPVPVDGEHVVLRIASSVRRLSSGRDLHPLAAPLPARLLTRVVHAALQRTYIHDVGADLSIWAHKRYDLRPSLAEGDGPIGRYRAWTRQFYPAARQARVRSA